MKLLTSFLFVIIIITACNDNASSTTSATDSVNKAADEIAREAQEAAEEARKGMLKTKLIPINKIDIDELEALIYNEETSAKVGIFSKSIQEQWMRLYKKCLKNKVFPNPFYLGLTNIYGIGTLVDRKSGEIVMSLHNKIPESDFSKFTIPATPFAEICSEAKRVKIDFITALNAVLQSITDTDLKSEIALAKNATIIAGEWRQLNSTTGDLGTYVDTSNAVGMANFRRFLYRENVYLVTAVLEVRNFSAKLTYDNELKIGTKEKFGSDSSNTHVISAGNTSFTIKRISSKELSVKCNSLFIPLVALSKPQREY